MIINGTNDIFEFCMQFIRWLKKEKRAKEQRPLKVQFSQPQQLNDYILCLKKNIVKNEWKEMSGGDVILNTPAHHHC